MISSLDIFPQQALSLHCADMAMNGGNGGCHG